MAVEQSIPAEPHIEFRALAEMDLDKLHAWLHEPEVRRWYSRDPASRAAIRRKYRPRIEGRSATRVFVIVLEGRDAGIIQTYRVADYPDYARAVASEPDWAGADFLIGEPEFRGRGFAHRIIKKFVDTIVVAQAAACLSAPHPDNAKSIRSLQRAGFAFLRAARLASGEPASLMLKRCRGGP